MWKEKGGISLLTRIVYQNENEKLSKVAKYKINLAKPN